MPPTTGYSFGDIVLVTFPFTDQSGIKKRPAVIVSSAAYNAPRRDVPMGGDLANAPAGKSPTLMIRALRDDIAKASQAINGVKLYPPAKAGQRISYHESQARKAAARYSSG